MKEKIVSKNPFVKFIKWCRCTIKWVVDFRDWKMLLRSVPGLITTMLCIAVIVMNLMANKIILNSAYIALDGGFLLSWIPFLCMDVVTKRYGPKAATKLNILALIINLLFVGVFTLISSIILSKRCFVVAKVNSSCERIVKILSLILFSLSCI